MTFSIITPSLNQGRFLRACIESVRAQDPMEWEHLVIDGGSTDETLSILREYSHLQWISEPDRGQSDAINKGFLRAGGDWVMWLNADDALQPGSLEKVLACARQHSEADVIYGGWHFIDETGNITKTSMVFPPNRMMLIHYGTYIGSTACFFRRHTVVAEGFLLNPNFRYTMDGEFYARLMGAEKQFRYLPEVLARFRIHGQNTSMVAQSDSSVDGLLRWQKQLAESAAIRRAYGVTLFHHPVADSIVDAIFWSFYRVKKIWLKLWYGSYQLISPS